MEKKEDRVSHRLGKRAYELGNYREAVSYFGKAMESAPFKVLCFDYAEALSKLQEHAKAREMYEGTYALLSEQENSDHALVLQCLAEQETHLDNFGKARELYHKCLETARRVMDSRKFDEFSREVQSDLFEMKALEATAGRRKYNRLFKQGKEFEDARKFAEAVEQYLSALKEDDNYEAYFRIATCFMGKREHSEAHNHFARAVSKKKERINVDDIFVIECIFLQGVCLVETGQLEEALVLFRRALEKSKYFANKSLIHKIELKHSETKLRFNLRERVGVSARISEVRDPAAIARERREAESVLECLDEDEKTEQVWHAVSVKWINEWREYHKSGPSPGSTYPGPIFNDELLNLDKQMKDPVQEPLIPIKPELKYKEDFIAVPTRLWDLWSSTYGGLDVPRRTYIISAPHIDWHLQRVQVTFKPNYDWVPKGVKVVFVERYSPSSDILEKCYRVVNNKLNRLGRSIKPEHLRLRMWRLNDPELEDIDAAIIKARSSSRFPIAIDGSVVEPSATVESIGMSDLNLVMVEVGAKDDSSLFEERKMAKPRALELNGNDTDLKSHLKVANIEFAKIPLRSIVSGSGRRGKLGLENNGNTCYMNSALQSLSACQELTKYFLLRLYRSEINADNPLGQKGMLAERYYDLLHDLWHGSRASLSTLELSRQIVRKAEQFRGYSQHDSQEFVLYLLDGLHEDLNRVAKKPYVESVDSPSKSEVDQRQKHWEYYLMRNQSIIVDLFGGQLKSRLVCPSCMHSSVTFDPFMMLSLPIPQVQFIKLTFVFRDLVKEGMKLQLSISSTATLDELTPRIKDQIRLPHGTRICYAIVNSNQVARRLRGSLACSTAPTLGPLFAYECDCEEEGCYMLEVRCQYISVGFFRTSYCDFAYPLLLPVPLTATIGDLRKMLREAFAFYFKEHHEECSDDKLPYDLEILNNRKHISHLFSTEYDPCEFCEGRPHSGNCLFKLKNESATTLRSVLDSISRDFILLLKIHNKRDDFKLDLLKDKFATFKEYITSVGSTKTRISLYDCLESFSDEEQLDSENKWFCPNCGKHVQALRKMEVHRVPRILILHIKRFKYRPQSYWSSSRKLEDFIEFPIKALQLHKLVKDHMVDEEYDLFAVVNHFGGLSGGHYTATCFNPLLSKWLVYDDSRVSNASDSDILSPAAYLLFYRAAS